MLSPRPRPSLRIVQTCAALALVLVLLVTHLAPRVQADADTVAAEAEAMLERLNEVRSTPTECGAEGEQPSAEQLELEERLNEAARRHASDMRAQEAIDHVGSDGSTVTDRIEEQGYDWAAAGENVAFGYEDVDDVVDGWLASDTHCVNMMRPAFEEMGIGRDGRYWALVLAAPR